MPSTVQDIISSLRNPVTVQRTDMVQDALNLMSEYNYSQLPVVDADNYPEGMVTSDSILRALGSFGTTLDTLRVEDAYIDAKTYNVDEDLFDLLNDLRDKYAVLIVDGDGKLKSIVTAFDATEYFRRSAEDMIVIRDIESNLKLRIQLTFTQPSGNLDQDSLDAVVQDIIDPIKGMNESIRHALRNYLKLQGDPQPHPNEQWIREIFTSLRSETGHKAFDKLTFQEYLDLIFANNQWPRYGETFGIGKKQVQHLLDGVRQARNQLAHFRGDLTAEQRNHIKHARWWLEQHQPTVPEPATPAITVVSEPISPPESNLDEMIPTEEANENRYAALRSWLQQRPREEAHSTLRFSDVETIIDHKLPPSAWEHRSWWANDSVGHVQSQEWLNAGWRVSNLTITGQTVTFSRMLDREEAYIKFFSGYKDKLHRIAKFRLKNTSPGGHSWFNAIALPFDGAQLATITAAFAQGKRFRIELYIDTGYQEKNKSVFDRLRTYQAEIEGLAGTKLTWERIDHKRASRVAIYYNKPISIISEKAALEQLLTWAVENTIIFYNAIAVRADEFLSTVQ